jgi:hypothetical protein
LLQPVFGGVLDEKAFARCDLTALVSVDFWEQQSPTQDKDYELTYTNLIKAVKIIMYKVSLLSKRQDIIKEELMSDFKTKLAEVRLKNEHAVGEVQAFASHLSGELESAGRRLRRDR